MRKLTVLFALATALSSPAWAADKLVTLSIPGMTCGACPITVRTALNRIPGVEKIGIDEAHKLVSVTYDDSKTNVQALVEATKDAGYPSSAKQQGRL
ncbi:MAG TPA: mercury resistance system periplasmic binding protein MerP [Pusillimonas sp.]|jgi:mercuric ion binding protein|uniref:mercury resistance system periplasmic binding protein MerP n=1 Tax=Pusillimonas sp. MFBS29 TaxID=2886690 RepID=UPI000C5704A6|nr:mercury resistance system periplasmic binding protein MerP [Pusillimonas sp. MFBS29]MAO49440.1 mercuric transport protein periplasmic component [Pusillimonas sp.]TKR55487.1 mercury resistance system periplasmic binding protein MerP [Allopusillimonas ginsengisoli]MBC41652.1 mercuric transport protein periplasmic component [Pusillimonas sp.]MCC2597339.1 mercury resistance system periplasmic binding protein MerP [Pusillimonas sp. MFBS29]HBT33248.1 mercury resistance system periplasmic binding |tara:strand:+ start:7160 stop:7450 length:291 start_codon:yes stop_codon:yes gene_type:complete